MKPATVFQFLASVVVIGTLAVSLSSLDSPRMARLRKLDEQRLSDLQQVSTSVGLYFRQHKSLPGTPDALNLPPERLADPVTKEPYAYAAKGSDSYQLCAVFDTASRSDEYNVPYYGGCRQSLWKHMVGRQCFTLSAQACP